MDSINKNQPEDNIQNLRSAEAIQQIRDLVEAAKTCFFCTAGIGGLSSGVRPMSVQKIDEQGICWFLSANDSHKNAEIQKDPTVRLYFQGSAHAEFLHLVGTAEILVDRQKINQLWQPLAKVWFTEGVTDPRITVIKFTPRSGYYWDNKHGKLVAGAKMVAGALLGKTLDDSIEGRLTV
jgi:general stress protein 26